MSEAEPFVPPALAKETFRRTGTSAAELVLDGWSANRTVPENPWVSKLLRLGLHASVASTV
jgi:hypothetical protein